jgi:hypothetical protein
MPHRKVGPVTTLMTLSCASTPAHRARANPGTEFSKTLIELRISHGQLLRHQNYHKIKEKNSKQRRQAKTNSKRSCVMAALLKICLGKTYPCEKL